MGLLNRDTEGTQSDQLEWSFKDAMRRVASTVCVLTTVHEGMRWGLTATAVCSLSVKPPALLACVNRCAEAHSAIVGSRRIGINILSVNQTAIARRFSGESGDRGEQRFAEGDWFNASTGAPLLSTAIAAFDCAIDEILSDVTHSILICRVQTLQIGDHAPPLLYSDRAYRTASPPYPL